MHKVNNILERLSISKYFDFIVMFALFIFGLLIFSGFFSFGLWGDDWMLSFYILEHRVAGTIPRLYFSLYGGQAILMDLMNHFFNYEPRYYFYASYILRYIASISTYHFANTLLKNKFIGILAGVLFLSSFSGIESTNWVHNSINYLAFSILLIGLKYWFIYRLDDQFEHKHKSLVISLSLFAVSIILAAVRMHGILPFIVLSELYLLITKRSNIFKSIYYVMLVFVIFLIFIKLGVFGAVGSFASGMLKNNLFLYLKDSPENAYKFLLLPIGSFANLILPTHYLSSQRYFQELLVNVNFGVLEFLIISVIILIFNIILFRKQLRIIFALQTLVMTILVIFGRAFSQNIGNNGSQILLGILILYIITVIYYKLRIVGHTAYMDYIILFTLVSFSFVLVTHVLLVNESTIETYSRYMTISSGAVSLLMSVVIFSCYELLKIKFSNIITAKLFTLLIIFSIVYMNIKGVKQFYKMSVLRKNSLVINVWNTINNYGSQIPYNGRIRIFVFEFDDKERDFYQTSIGFGGTYRYAISNGINDRQQLVVFISKDELGILVKAFSDPSVGVNHWGPIIHDELRLSDIHGFLLKNNQIFQEDATIRDKISKLISN